MEITNTDLKIREKLTEYMLLVAPLERAGEEIEFSRRAIKAQVEDQIHHIAPVLGALAETLRVSTVDMLLSPDRRTYVEQALERSDMTVDEIRQRLIESSETAQEDLKLLGFDSSISSPT